MGDQNKLLLKNNSFFDISSIFSPVREYQINLLFKFFFFIIFLLQNQIISSNENNIIEMNNNFINGSESDNGKVVSYFKRNLLKIN